MLEGFKPISITTGFPSMTITKNGVGFNKSAILKMDGPTHVRVMINNEKNMIAICPCKEDDDYAISFAKDGRKSNSVRWNNKDFLGTLATMTGWDGNTRGRKISGQYYQNENILVFDMNKAVELDGIDEE